MTRPVRPVDFGYPTRVGPGFRDGTGRPDPTRPTMIPPPKNQEITFNVHLVSILVTEIGGGFLDLSALGISLPALNLTRCVTVRLHVHTKSNTAIPVVISVSVSEKPARWEISSISQMSLNGKNLETLPCLVSRWGWFVL